MKTSLEHKVALVTGASGGLGFATALRLVQEDSEVIIVSRSEENLEKAVASIYKETGKTVKSFAADVSKVEDIERLFGFVKSTYDRLDIVVSNSGGPKLGTFENLTDEDWAAAYNNSLMSTVHLFKNAIPLVKKGSGGRFVVITTTGAKQPQPNLILSNVMRAGIHALVKTLSAEVAFMTDRQMFAVKKLAERENLSIADAIEKRLIGVSLNRMGEPIELANYIAFLCSNQANYITGTALNIDGGFIKSI